MALLVAAALFGFLRPAKTLTSQRTTKLAGAERYLALPAVRAGIVRGRRLALVGLLTAGLVGLGGAVVAARPAETTVTQREVANRDVVLCLDISGSMTDTSVETVMAYAAMVEGFEGERVAMSIFNARSVTVFPLTDDYDFLAARLEEMAEFLGMELDPWNEATLLPFLGVLDPNDEASSLIGDGLAMCVELFDHPELERSRSLVFVTDNELNGEPLITLDQAAAMARKAKVKVYAIDPYTHDLPGEARELEAAVLSTGGGFFEAVDAAAVEQVVARITAEQAAPMVLPPLVVVTDHPWFGAVLVALGLVALGAVLAPGQWLKSQLVHRRARRRGLPGNDGGGYV